MTDRRTTTRANPFPYARELSSTEVVDRTEELTAIRRVAESQGRQFLIGPRRFGKSSILSAADEQLTASGIVVLRYDAEAYESLDLLAQALLTGALRHLTSSIDKAAAEVRRAARGLRPEVTMNLATQEITVGLTGISGTETVPTLTAALDAINRLAGSARKRVLVILDEFQHVVETGGLAAERQIRAAVQRHRNVGYVFSGSETRLLTQMTSDASRPFWRLGERRFLGPIRREDFRPFLTDGFAAAGHSPRPDAIEAILDLAEDVPYNVQRLASASWELLRSQGAQPLRVQHVQQALANIVRGEHPAYARLWASLTVPQKRALKAVVTENGVALLGRDALTRARISASSMQRALAALDTQGLVRVADTESGPRYRLEDPFIAAWLQSVQHDVVWAKAADGQGRRN